MGNVVSRGQIKPNSDRENEIASKEKPTTLKTLRSALGSKFNNSSTLKLGGSKENTQIFKKKKTAHQVERKYQRCGTIKQTSNLKNQEESSSAHRTVDDKNGPIRIQSNLQAR